jgi:hypothetical protein
VRRHHSVRVPRWTASSTWPVINTIVVPVVRQTPNSSSCLNDAVPQILNSGKPRRSGNAGQDFSVLNWDSEYRLSFDPCGQPHGVTMPGSARKQRHRLALHRGAAVRRERQLPGRSLFRVTGLQSVAQPRRRFPRGPEELREIPVPKSMGGVAERSGFHSATEPALLQRRVTAPTVRGRVVTRFITETSSVLRPCASLVRRLVWRCAPPAVSPPRPHRRCCQRPDAR